MSGNMPPPPFKYRVTMMVCNITTLLLDVFHHFTHPCLMPNQSAWESRIK